MKIVALNWFKYEKIEWLIALSRNVRNGHGKYCSLQLEVYASKHKIDNLPDLGLHNRILNSNLSDVI